MHKVRLLHNIAVVVLAVISFLIVLGGVGVNAYAVETASNVLTDLRKDSNFNFVKYPEKPQDYSLQVFQIAESTDGELLIYVYQPSGTKKNLCASSINIARVPDNSADLKFYPYSLQRLSANGVFFKYKVLNFKLGTAAVRYYNISNILRPFDGTIDPPPEGDNTSSEVSNRVGQFWMATTANGNVTYTMSGSDTVEVTEKYVGMLRYSDGYWFLGFMACDSHYIAFSTDIPMGELLSADVYYKSRTVERNYMLGIQSSVKFGDEQETTTTLNSDDLGSNSPRGWFSEKKSWYVIQQAAAFIEENQDLNNAAIDNIKNKQWVIRFTETSFKKEGDYKVSREVSSEVTDVIILRLEFKTNGKVYNLGVVDNKQTGSNKPNNSIGFWEFIWRCIVNTFKGIGKWYEVLVTVVVGVAAVTLVVLAVMFIKFIVRGLFK